MPPITIAGDSGIAPVVAGGPVADMELIPDSGVDDEGDGWADDLPQGPTVFLTGQASLTHHVLSPDSDVLNFWAHLREFGSLIAFVEVQGSNAEEAEEHAQILKARIDEDA